MKGIWREESFAQDRRQIAELEKDAAYFDRKISGLQDPAQLAKGYYRELRKSTLSTLPEPSLLLDVAKSPDLTARNKAIGVAVNTGDMTPLRAYLADKPLETRMALAISVANYCDIGSSASEHNNARRAPLFAEYLNEMGEADRSNYSYKALELSRHYADQPYAEPVLTTAAKYHTNVALRCADNYKTEPYAERFITNIANQDPDSALDVSSYYNEEPYAERILTIVAKNNPQKVFEHISGYQDNYSRQPYAAAVLSVAAENSPEEAFSNIQRYADRDYTADILTKALNSKPRAAFWYANKYIDKPFAQTVITQAARMDPEAALEYIDEYKDQQYAKEIITEAASKEPEIALKYSDSLKESSLHQHVVETAIGALQDRPGKIFQMVHYFSNEPYAQSVLEQAVKQDEYGRIFDHTESLKELPYAKDLLLEATKINLNRALNSVCSYPDLPFANDIFREAVSSVEREKAILSVRVNGLSEPRKTELLKQIDLIHPDWQKQFSREQMRQVWRIDASDYTSEERQTLMSRLESEGIKTQLFQPRLGKQVYLDVAPESQAEFETRQKNNLAAQDNVRINDRELLENSPSSHAWLDNHTSGSSNDLHLDNSVGALQEIVPANRSGLIDPVLKATTNTLGQNSFAFKEGLGSEKRIDLETVYGGKTDLSHIKENILSATDRLLDGAVPVLLRTQQKIKTTCVEAIDKALADTETQLSSLRAKDRKYSDLVEKKELLEMRKDEFSTKIDFAESTAAIESLLHETRFSNDDFYSQTHREYNSADKKLLEFMNLDFMVNHLTNTYNPLLGNTGSNQLSDDIHRLLEPARDRLQSYGTLIQENLGDHHIEWPKLSAVELSSYKEALSSELANKVAEWEADAGDKVKIEDHIHLGVTEDEIQSVEKQHNALYLKTLDAMLREHGAPLTADAIFSHPYGTVGSQPLIYLKDFSGAEQNILSAVFKNESTTPYRFDFNFATVSEAGTAPLMAFDVKAIALLKRYGVPQEAIKKHMENFLKMAQLSEHDGTAHQPILAHIQGNPVNFLQSTSLENLPDFFTEEMREQAREIAKNYEAEINPHLGNVDLPKAFSSNYLEDHALALHAQILDRMFVEAPKRKEFVLRYAAEAFEHINEIQKTALAHAATAEEKFKVNEATTYLAEIYYHRLARVISPADPDLHRAVSVNTVSGSREISAADAAQLLNSGENDQHLITPEKLKLNGTPDALGILEQHSDDAVGKGTYRAIHTIIEFPLLYTARQTLPENEKEELRKAGQSEEAIGQVRKDAITKIGLVKTLDVFTEIRRHPTIENLAMQMALMKLAALENELIDPTKGETKTPMRAAWDKLENTFTQVNQAFENGELPINEAEKRLQTSIQDVANEASTSKPEITKQFIELAQELQKTTLTYFKALNKNSESPESRNTQDRVKSPSATMKSNETELRGRSSHMQGAAGIYGTVSSRDPRYGNIDQFALPEESGRFRTTPGGLTGVPAGVGLLQAANGSGGNNVVESLNAHINHEKTNVMQTHITQEQALDYGRENAGALTEAYTAGKRLYIGVNVSDLPPGEKFSYLNPKDAPKAVHNEDGTTRITILDGAPLEIVKHGLEGLGHEFNILPKGEYDNTVQIVVKGLSEAQAQGLIRDIHYTSQTVTNAGSEGIVNVIQAAVNDVQAKELLGWWKEQGRSQADYNNLVQKVADIQVRDGAKIGDVYDDKATKIEKTRLVAGNEVSETTGFSQDGYYVRNQTKVLIASGENYVLAGSDSKGDQYVNGKGILIYELDKEGNITNVRSSAADHATSDGNFLDAKGKAITSLDVVQPIKLIKVSTSVSGETDIISSRPEPDGRYGPYSKVDPRNQTGFDEGNPYRAPQNEGGVPKFIESKPYIFPLDVQPKSSMAVYTPNESLTINSDAQGFTPHEVISSRLGNGSTALPEGMRLVTGSAVLAPVGQSKSAAAFEPVPHTAGINHAGMALGISGFVGTMQQYKASGYDPAYALSAGAMGFNVVNDVTQGTMLGTGKAAQVFHEFKLPMAIGFIPDLVNLTQAKTDDQRNAALTSLAVNGTSLATLSSLGGPEATAVILAANYVGQRTLAPAIKIADGYLTHDHDKVVIGQERLKAGGAELGYKLGTLPGNVALVGDVVGGVGDMVTGVTDLMSDVNNKLTGNHNSVEQNTGSLALFGLVLNAAGQKLGEYADEFSDWSGLGVSERHAAKAHGDKANELQAKYNQAHKFKVTLPPEAVAMNSKLEAYNQATVALTTLLAQKESVRTSQLDHAYQQYRSSYQAVVADPLYGAITENNLAERIIKTDAYKGPYAKDNLAVVMPPAGSLSEMKARNDDATRKQQELDVFLHNPVTPLFKASAAAFDQHVDGYVAAKRQQRVGELAEGSYAALVKTYDKESKAFTACAKDIAQTQAKLTYVTQWIAGAGAEGAVVTSEALAQARATFTSLQAERDTQLSRLARLETQNTAALAQHHSASAGNRLYQQNKETAHLGEVLGQMKTSLAKVEQVLAAHPLEPIAQGLAALERKNEVEGLTMPGAPLTANTVPPMAALAVDTNGLTTPGNISSVAPSSPITPVTSPSTNETALQALIMQSPALANNELQNKILTEAAKLVTYYEQGLGADGKQVADTNPKLRDGIVDDQKMQAILRQLNVKFKDAGITLTPDIVIPSISTTASKLREQNNSRS